MHLNTLRLQQSYTNLDTTSHLIYAQFKVTTPPEMYPMYDALLQILCFFLLFCTLLVVVMKTSGGNGIQRSFCCCTATRCSSSLEFQTFCFVECIRWESFPGTKEGRWRSALNISLFKSHHSVIAEVAKRLLAPKKSMGKWSSDLTSLITILMSLWVHQFWVILNKTVGCCCFKYWPY